MELVLVEHFQMPGTLPTGCLLSKDGEDLVRGGGRGGRGD